MIDQDGGVVTINELDQSQHAGGRLANRSQTDLAADRLASLARGTIHGGRIGSKEEVRALFSVSVGTLNEAIRLVQAQGLVTLRSGPGGGLFAAQQSPMVRLGNSVLALDSEPTSVADAIRIRNALDLLTVEDALWHSSPADIDQMRQQVEHMRGAVESDDSTAFVRANWKLHACIATVSTNRILRSFYLSLLDIIESHTLSVMPVTDQPLPSYIAQRYSLHHDLVEAIAGRDRDRALALIGEHNTTDHFTQGQSASVVSP